jgi:hypothetical protein
MARLLLQWLNEEVGLSREITSISHDFCNGYLLGELLHRYNQQQHFNQFIDKDTPDAKIRNYTLLEPTLRQIGVFFNSKIAFEIMNSKSGSVKSLLYEIKTVLSDAVTKTVAMDGTTNKKLIKIIHPSKPNYDQTMYMTFENSIRAFMDNPKDLLMEKAVKQFTERGEMFHQSVSTNHR